MAITYEQLVAITHNEYTTLPELLAKTGNGDFAYKQMAEEFGKSQTIGRDLPIKVASGRFEDTGAFLEPWQYNKASHLAYLGGPAKYVKFDTYSRKDIMGFRKAAIGIEEDEYAAQGALGNWWRAQQADKLIRDMGLDMEHDIFYGDPIADDRNFLGLQARFGIITDMDGIVKSGAHAGEKSPYITLDAGGTGSALTSVYLIYPNAKNGVAWIIPNDETTFTGGLEIKRGKFTDMNTVDTDGEAGVVSKASDRYRVMRGLGMMNRQAGIRIANVDVSTEAGFLQFERCLIEAQEAVEPEIANGFIAYASPKLRVDLKQKYWNKVAPVTFTNAKIPAMVGDFNLAGMPFRKVVHLTNAESQLT